MIFNQIAARQLPSTDLSAFILEIVTQTSMSTRENFRGGLPAHGFEPFVGNNEVAAGVGMDRFAANLICMGVF